MTPVRALDRLTLMTGDTPSETVTIRFEPRSTPITGIVSTAGKDTPFTGWIELAGLIEAMHPLASPERAEGEEKFVDPPR